MQLDEEGKPINPHIPQFMASAPWYLNSDQPSLKHQKNWKGGSSTSEKTWYDRGAKIFQATKYRKGACENCGSMSHKTKDCLERPRTKGAKWTNKNIAADDKVEDLNISDFDIKRDRWNGYDADEWIKQAEKFDKVAKLRQETRQNELLEDKEDEDRDMEGAVGRGEDPDGAIQQEEDKVEDEELAGFSKLEMRVRASGSATGTVRNLRIREDTAKYLLNLDVDSAYYDPKSRSMREDPNPRKDPSEKTFTGDNFVRQSGANKGFQDLNLFSVTAYEKGQDVHTLATPSQAEAAFQAFKAKKEALKSKTKENLAEKYGNAAEQQTEEVLALRGNEAYAEYDAAGRLVRGQDSKPKSRYEEDIHPGNHTTVWGSYWKDGQWGYQCCKQMTKNAYCTGDAGEAAAQEAAMQLQKNLLVHAEKEREKMVKKDEGNLLEGVKPGLPGVWGTDADKEDVQIDEKKLREAMKRHEERMKNNHEDDRKRGYNSLQDDYNVSAEDMEAYRLKKSRGDDPLQAIEKSKAMAKNRDGGGGYDLV